MRTQAGRRRPGRCRACCCPGSRRGSSRLPRMREGVVPCGKARKVERHAATPVDKRIGTHPAHIRDLRVSGACLRLSRDRAAGVEAGGMDASARPQKRRRGRSAPYRWRVSDELWARLARSCRSAPSFPLSGPLPLPARECLEGVLYVLYTDTPWLEVPYRELGLPSGETCRRRLEEWSRRGLLSRRSRSCRRRWPGGQARLVAGARGRLAGGREKGGEKVARTLLGRSGSRYHLAVDTTAPRSRCASRPATRTSAGTCSRSSTSSPARGIRHASSGPTAATPPARSSKPCAHARSSRASVDPAAPAKPSPPAPARARSGAAQTTTRTPDPQARHRWPVERTNAWLKANDASPPAATAKPTTTSPSSTSA